MELLHSAKTAKPAEAIMLMQKQARKSADNAAKSLGTITSIPQRRHKGLQTGQKNTTGSSAKAATSFGTLTLNPKDTTVLSQVIYEENVNLYNNSRFFSRRTQVIRHKTY